MRKQIHTAIEIVKKNCQHEELGATASLSHNNEKQQPKANSAQTIMVNGAIRSDVGNVSTMCEQQQR